MFGLGLDVIRLVIMTRLKVLMSHTLDPKNHYHDMSCLQVVHKFSFVTIQPFRCHVKSQMYSLSILHKSSQRTHKYFKHSFVIIAVQKLVKGDFMVFNAFI